MSAKIKFLRTANYMFTDYITNKDILPELKINTAFKKFKITGING
jgi:hypothetical protein